MVASFSASGFFVQTPWGPRKSGIPDSVEMPAPVSATIRRAAAIQPRTVSTIRSVDSIIGEPPTQPICRRPPASGPPPSPTGGRGESDSRISHMPSHLPRQSRVERVAHAIPQEVDGQDGGGEEQPRKDDDVEGDLEDAPPFRQDVAPAGNGGRRAGADEGQHGFDD